MFDFWDRASVALMLIGPVVYGALIMALTWHYEGKTCSIFFGLIGGVMLTALTSAFLVMVEDFCMWLKHRHDPK